jgi:hypothetical protein
LLLTQKKLNYIKDNGIGSRYWQLIELVRQGHYGLAGAAERVALLEGVLWSICIWGKVPQPGGSNQGTSFR